MTKIDYYVKKVKTNFADAQILCDNGDEKLGILLADMAYDNIPEKYVEMVRSIVEMAE
jgi:hypothetical protein